MGARQGPPFSLYPQVPVSARRNRPTPGIRDSHFRRLQAHCHDRFPEIGIRIML
jgi:hypothetical protein